MSQPDAPRSMLAEGVIALAVCVGAYMLGLEPAQRELAEARAAIEQRESTAAEQERFREILPRLSSRLESVRQTGERIDSASEPARDQGRLYADLSRLAFEHDVRLDRLNPVGASGINDGGRTMSVGYDLAVVGMYADLIGFLQALESDAGFTRVRSVTATPVMDPSQEAVLALIRTEHFAFDPSPVPIEALLAAEGDPNAPAEGIH